jgi:uncharacterized membrane protein YbhN (UPF0104 family)
MARLQYAVLLLGLCVFAFFVHQVGLGVIVRNVRAMGFWFLAVLAVWLAAYILNTCTFALILAEDRERVGWVRLLGTVMAGFAMNYSTPFLHVGGEPFRIAVLKKWVGGPRATFATLSYKALNAGSSLCYWTIGAVVMASSGRLSTAASVLLVAVPAGVLVTAALFVRRHSENVFVSVRKLTSRYRWLAFADRALAKRAGALQEVDDDLRELWRTRTRVLWAALAIETAARLLLSLELFIILRAVGQPVDLLTGLQIDSAANLMLTAAFFIPFELGAREGGLYLILSSFGMASGVGVFVALVNRIREIFWIGVGLTWGHFLAAPPRLREAAVASE